VQEVVGEFGGEKGEAKWYEKVIEGVGNSEAAVNLINRLTGGPPPQNQQQVPPQYQLPPPGVPFQLPGDPNTYVVDNQGNTRIIQQRPRPLAEAQQRKRRRSAKPAEGGDEEGRRSPRSRAGNL
jgi:hypothetical protein